MNIIHDKQNRYFMTSILAVIIFSFLFSALISSSQTTRVQNILLSHDKAVASSLLTQGVSEQIAAAAIMNTEENTAGTQLLNKIGLSQYTEFRLLPPIQDFNNDLKSLTFSLNIFCSVLLVISVIFFLRSRERLYLNAIEAVAAYINGDYSIFLPQKDDGSLSRLFSSIHNMALVLKSRQETEHNTKVFLKNTVSDISHQLKTPLAALRMYNEIILNEPGSRDTVTAFSEKSTSSLERMEKLIQSLLKLTRLDASGVSFQKRMYPVTDLIAEAVEDLQTRASLEEKEIIISGNTKDRIFCDMHWTSEAIGNIVKNALDHIVKGGQVHISWEQSSAIVRIIITDNGKGIAPEDLYHIFKRFYRGCSSKHSEGIGLGLPLAKSIVDGQNGFLSVQSLPSAGTTFTLSFPAESY